MKFLFFCLYAVGDASEGAVIQCKGRFKVTSADLSPKVRTVLSIIPTFFSMKQFNTNSHMPLITYVQNFHKMY